MADRGTWKINIGGTDLATYLDIVNGDDNDGGPEVQPERLFEADQITNYERGNFDLKLQFSIVQEQANNAASVDLFLKGPQLWSGVKTVILTHKDHTGAEAVRTITGAAVRLRCSQPIGVTNIMTLSISGGKVT